MKGVLLVDQRGSERLVAVLLVLVNGQEFNNWLSG